MDKFNINDWYKNAVLDSLKHCPMCGADAPKLTVPNKDNKESVHCLECGLKIEKALGVGVVQAWNNRV